MNNGITALQSLSGSSSVSGPSGVGAFRPEPSAAVTSAVNSVDRTRLSTVSDLVTKALSQVDPSSDVRLDKILPIQQAIANGSYSVSANDVAGKIVDSLLV